MGDQSQYHIQPTYHEEEEIQIGPFFSNLRKSFVFVLKKWWVLLLFCIVFGLLTQLYTIWYGTKYIATATFTVEGQSATSGLLSSALSLANALGLNSASTPKTNVYNNNFFANLIESRKVIKEALMEEAEMKGKTDLLANHYITLYKWRNGSWLKKGWDSDPKLKNFYFTKKPLTELNNLEDSVLNIIYDNILNSNLEVTYEESSPFNIATFTTRNRDFSKNMLKAMLENASGYYMANVYDLNQQNMQIADLRVDSLGRELRKLDYRVASLRDQSNNVIRQKGLIDVNSAQRNQALLNTQYSAAVNNVEMAKVTILTTAPILQIIDDPEYATEVSFVRWYIALIVGIFLGLFFGTIYLLILRAVRLSNEKIKERQKQMDNSGTAAA